MLHSCPLYRGTEAWAYPLRTARNPRPCFCTGTWQSLRNCNGVWLFCRLESCRQPTKIKNTSPNCSEVMQNLPNHGSHFQVAAVLNLLQVHFSRAMVALARLASKLTRIHHSWMIAKVCIKPNQTHKRSEIARNSHEPTGHCATELLLFSRKHHT